MTADGKLLAIATFIGPIAAVLITIWLQSRFEARARKDRNEFQKELLRLQAEYQTQARDGWQRSIDAWVSQQLPEALGKLQRLGLFPKH